MTEPSPIDAPQADIPAPTTGKPQKRRLGCLAKLFLVFLSGVLSLVLAEIVIRVFADEVLPNPIGPRHLFEPDEVIGVRLRPGFDGRFALYDEFDVPVKINSMGYRDREFGEKKPGVKRILSLGDSFAFGYGVRSEDTYAKVLENRLNPKGADRNIEVLNAGASGRGILHMIEILKRTRDWYKPDIVVASFFFVNDLLDIETFPEHTVRGGIVLIKGIGANVDRSAWLNFCFNYSDLGLLAERVRLKVMANLDVGTSTPPGGAWGTDLLRVATSASKSEAKRFEKRAELWKRFETHLATLDRETKAAGAQLVLFSIPLDYQTRGEVWDRMKAKGQVDERFDRNLISEKLTGICGRTGVRFLDLVPGFRQTPPESTRFFPLNKHFNEEGHAFAAELLDRYLRDSGML